MTAVAFSVLQFCDNGDDLQRGIIKEIVLFVHSHRLKASLCFAAIQVLCACGIRYVTWRTPFDHGQLQKTLNLIVSHCFDNLDQENYDYRATVFKIRGVRGIRRLTGQWVGIVCRSGENYDQSGTIFLVDRMCPDKSTGIVGRCFGSEGQTVMPVSLLPVDDAEKYKAACHLADIEYEAMNVKSKIVFATGIKRQGRLWGFLVLDTTDEAQLPSSRATNSKRRDIGSWAEVVGTMIT